jgi:hypothetical protein
MIDALHMPDIIFLHPSLSQGYVLLDCIRGLYSSQLCALGLSCQETRALDVLPELSRDSPDESQTGINVRVFPALLQDRGEVLTATSTSGNPNAWSRV